MPPPKPIVWIDRSAFVSLVASAIESYDREATGFLVGRKADRTIRGRRRRVTLLEAAYPLITSDRKRTSVGPQNEAAYDRALRVVHGMDVGLHVIGGFHSHPNHAPTLSEGDLRFVQAHVAHVERRGWGLLDGHWLELIVGLRRRKMQRQAQTDWYWQEDGDHLRARIWMPGRERFDLHVAAHSVDPYELGEDGELHLRRAVRPVKLLTGL